MIELESLAGFDAHLAAGRTLSGVVLQGLRLRDRTEKLRSAEVEGALFLGCDLDESIVCGLITRGALLFPRLEDVPFDAYRSQLYTPEELLGSFDGSLSYDETLDGKIYQHYLAEGGPKAPRLKETLARRLHDHAMTDARDEFIADRRLVALMGGHGLGRNEPGYAEVAGLSAQLTARGFLMSSGGGPGAMEATHLGAWFAQRSAAELAEAISILAEAPFYTPIETWLSTAQRVAREFPRQSEPTESLGIPTWLYGHEPPTLFASHIAKYFSNSVREAGLLTIATQGIIFTPGSAGTIQEIFQDATQNHYETLGFVSPMIFLGRRYWTETKPIYPLLHKLAAGRAYQDWVRITDDPAEAIEWIESFVPQKPGDA